MHQLRLSSINVCISCGWCVDVDVTMCCMTLSTNSCVVLVIVVVVKNSSTWRWCFVDQHNIEIVREWQPNNISATKIRYLWLSWCVTVLVMSELRQLLSVSAYFQLVMCCLWHRVYHSSTICAVCDTEFITVALYVVIHSHQETKGSECV